MDEPLTWKSLSARLAAMPRGSKHQLSKKLGLDPSDFYRRLNRSGELTERQARIVRAFLGESEAEAANDPGPPPTVSGPRLPIYGYAAASDGDLIALNEGHVVDWLELPHGLLLGPGEYFAVRPIGSSMEPRIFPGETLVVRRNYPPARDKDVVLEFADGSGLIKTYEGQRQGRIFVKQWNEPRTLDFDATGVKLHAVAFKL